MSIQDCVFISPADRDRRVKDCVDCPEKETLVDSHGRCAGCREEWLNGYLKEVRP